MVHKSLIDGTIWNHKQTFWGLLLTLSMIAVMKRTFHNKYIKLERVETTALENDIKNYLV